MRRPPTSARIAPLNGSSATRAPWACASPPSFKVPRSASTCAAPRATARSAARCALRSNVVRTTRFAFVKPSGMLPVARRESTLARTTSNAHESVTRWGTHSSATTRTPKACAATIAARPATFSRSRIDSTTSRRARALPWSRRGEYDDGALGNPASIAASASVTFEMLLPNRSRLAPSTPYTPLPR